MGACSSSNWKLKEIVMFSFLSPSCFFSIRFLRPGTHRVSGARGEIWKLSFSTSSIDTVVKIPSQQYSALGGPCSVHLILGATVVDGLKSASRLCRDSVTPTEGHGVLLLNCLSRIEGLVQLDDRLPGRSRDCPTINTQTSNAHSKMCIV